MKAIAVKLKCIHELPKDCGDCVYLIKRPDPFYVYVQEFICKLCNVRIDGTDMDDGWFYDGSSRPKNCPLFETELEESNKGVAPTVDTVEVVRCKDCIHRKEYECDEITLGNVKCGTTDNWFCAYGEKHE